MKYPPTSDEEFLSYKLRVAKAATLRPKTLSRWSDLLHCPPEFLQPVSIKDTDSVLRRFQESRRDVLFTEESLADAVESAVLDLGRSGLLWLFDDYASDEGGIEVRTNVVYREWRTLITLDANDLCVCSADASQGFMVEWLSNLGRTAPHGTEFQISRFSSVTPGP